LEIESQTAWGRVDQVYETNIKGKLLLLLLVMLSSNSREIDAFKMEELKFKDHLISETKKVDQKLNTTKVKLQGYFKS
jgi:hypothetical protein